MKNKIKSNRLYLESEKDTTVREILTELQISKKQMGVLDASNDMFINTLKARLDTIVLNGQEISLPLYTSKELSYKETNLQLEIIYEDDILLIVNKPSDLLTHTDESDQLNLQDLVDNHLIISGNPIVCNPIHRLDKETSGLIIYSKSGLFKSYFDNELAEKNIHRSYYALCDNPFKRLSKGRIEVTLAKDRHNSNMYRIADSGKTAITIYEVIRNYMTFSLLKLDLETGRTHQIRVSLAAKKHPIVGDNIYNEKSAEVMKLQAYTVSLTHPLKNEIITLEIPIRKDIKNYIGKKNS